MPETFTITPTESLAIRQSTTDRLEVEVTYARAGSGPPKHFHPGQDEHFEVLAGTLEVRVARLERTLRAGDTIDIPRSAVHQMWNPADEPARAVWQTSPAGRTEQWFRAIDSLHREGRVRSDGMPGPLAFGVLLTEYRDVFRLAVPAAPIVRGVLALLARVGRARGYSPHPRTPITTT